MLMMLNGLAARGLIWPSRCCRALGRREDARLAGPRVRAHRASRRGRDPATWPGPGLSRLADVPDSRLPKAGPASSGRRGGNCRILIMPLAATANIHPTWLVVATECALTNLKAKCVILLH